jgi:ribosome-associated heat shock protein Hsp15
MAEQEKLRVDKYLWAIRLYKTRSLASEACVNNKVKSKDVNVKASKTVNIGDEFAINTEAKKWIIKVTGLLHTRLQYSEAVKYYVDHTPDEEKEKVKETAFIFQTGKRQSKQGRPTKKQKRELDDYISPL